MRGAEAETKSHGEFLAGAVGEIAGVSGTTIGQWARWGYIRASRSDGIPHVYAFEDVLEALMVKALLDRGVSRMMIRRAVAQLQEYGDWPLTEAQLATTAANGRRPRIILREDDGAYALSPRGWQRMVAPPPYEDVRLRLKRAR